ncbi:MAG: hypothetical protein R3B13_17810 [Polyangiaceae bacterium]
MSRDKQTILERRRRFLAAALTSAGVAAAVQGCGGKQAEPQACLEPPREHYGPDEYVADAGPATDDAGSAEDAPQPLPQPCLSDVPPQVCLSPPPMPDLQPQVCLEPPMNDPE